MNVEGKRLTVTRSDGSAAYSTDSATDGLICTLAPGIYVVKTGDNTYKVLVP